MHKKGFSLIELIIVLSIVSLLFAMFSVVFQSLKLTSSIMKQNDCYSAISHIYSKLLIMEDSIAFKNDFTNNQFYFQMPKIDNNSLIEDPIKGGTWYSIKLENNKLYKINQDNMSRIQISPEDIEIKSTTFDFDNISNQIRITIDFSLENKNIRSNIVINTFNILNLI